MQPILNNAIFWCILSVVCILEGLLLIIGKAKSLSIFNSKKDKSRDIIDRYIKKDGIGSIIFGVILLIGAFLVMSGNDKYLVFLLITDFVVYVSYEFYLLTQLKNE